MRIKKGKKLKKKKIKINDDCRLQEFPQRNKQTENKQYLLKSCSKAAIRAKVTVFSQWPSFANECIIDNTSTLTSTPNKGWHGTHPRACVYSSEPVYGVGKYTQSRGFRCQSLSLAILVRAALFFNPKSYQPLRSALVSPLRYECPGPIPFPPRISSNVYSKSRKRIYKTTLGNLSSRERKKCSGSQSEVFFSEVIYDF